MQGSCQALLRSKAPSFDPEKVIAPIIDFYEHTAAYEFDVWSQWRGPLTPFAHAFIRLASREIEQCNLPLSPLDSSRGVESAVWPMRAADGRVMYTGWLRHVAATKNVLFVGCYTTVTAPKSAATCVKVVFPLPHGSATVLLRPENKPDGSFKLVSAGKGVLAIRGSTASTSAPMAGSAPSTCPSMRSFIFSLTATAHFGPTTSFVLRVCTF